MNPDQENKSTVTGVALVGQGGDVAASIGGEMAVQPGAPELIRPHAATAAAATVDPLLTDFATGFPRRPVDEVMDWFCPSTPVPLSFQYRAKAMANVLGGVTDDAIGASGEAGLVYPDTDGMVAAELVFRGLETPITIWDERKAAAGLGDSAAALVDRRAEFLLNQLRNGRVMRFVTILNSAAGAATDLTVYADQNPFALLKTHINVVKLEAGGPENVHVVMGYGVRSGMDDHPVLNGTAKGEWHEVSDEKIAKGFGLPAENIHTSWHQIVATKQGRSTAKSVLLAANEVYIFVRSPRPSKDDNGWMHSFVINGGISDPRTAAVVTGQRGPFEMYRTPRGANAFRLGARYFDLQKATNTSAKAKKRLAVTWSAEAAP